jgi:hypothetical protein
MNGSSAMGPDQLHPLGADTSDHHIGLVVGADDVGALGVRQAEVVLMRSGEWSIQA